VAKSKRPVVEEQFAPDFDAEIARPVEEQLARDLDKAMRDKDHLTDAVKQMLVKNGVLDDAIDILQDRTAHQHNNIEQLKGELDASRRTNQQLRKEIVVLKATIKITTDQQNDIKQLKSRLDTSHREHQQLKSELGASRHENQQLKSELDASRHENQQLRKRIESLAPHPKLTEPQRAQRGVGYIAERIASGVLVAAGVSTVALLAAGGLAPLIIPAVGSKLTADIAFGWLSGIGSNALASWVQTWAGRQVAEIKRPDVAEQLARALDKAMRDNDHLTNDVVNMLDTIGVKRMLHNTLHGRAAQQRDFIRRLRSDQASLLTENQRLLEWSRALETALQESLLASSERATSQDEQPGTHILATQQLPTGPPDGGNQKLLDTLFQRDFKAES
jgi:hypothetical protein